jgi:hypothetical protein
MTETSNLSLGGAVPLAPTRLTLTAMASRLRRRDEDDDRVDEAIGKRVVVIGVIRVSDL